MLDEVIGENIAVLCYAWPSFILLCIRLLSKSGHTSDFANLANNPEWEQDGCIQEAMFVMMFRGQCL